MEVVMKLAIIVTLLTCATLNADVVKSGAIGRVTSPDSYQKIDTIVLTALEEYAVQGLLLDSNASLINDPALNDLITWDLIGVDTSGIQVTETVGSQTSITGKIAYVQGYLRMNYKNTPLDTAFVSIKPGLSMRLCIDTTQNYNPRVLHKIEMLSNSVYLYAFFVDSSGNKIGFPDNIIWSVQDTTLVAIDTSGGSSSGCTIIAKTDSFLTQIYYSIDSVIFDTVIISKIPASVTHNRTMLNRTPTINSTAFDLLGRTVNAEVAAIPGRLTIHRRHKIDIPTTRLSIH